jgi:hypothetical protein
MVNRKIKKFKKRLLFLIAEKLAAARKAASQEMNTNKPVLKPSTPQQR